MLCALVDSCATRAKELKLEPGSNQPLAVISMDGHWRQTYATITLTTRLQDFNNKLLKTTKPMIFADIVRQQGDPSQGTLRSLTQTCSTLP